MNKFSAELLDCIADEIQPQDPRIALAIDRVSDTLEHRANLELLADTDVRKFIEERAHDAQPLVKKIENDLQDAWEILRQCFHQGLDPEAEYQVPSGSGLGPLYNKLKDLRENFQALQDKIESARKEFHSPKKQAYEQDEDSLAYQRYLGPSHGKDLMQELADVIEQAKNQPGILKKLRDVQKKFEALLSHLPGHREACKNPMLVELSLRRIDSAINNLFEWAEDVMDKDLKSKIKSNLSTVAKEIQDIKKQTAEH
jgi:hypothetical protein